MAYRISQKCTGCMACITSCPTGAIHGDRELLHVIDPGRCIDCGACGGICPDGAIVDNHGALCAALRVASRARAYVDLGVCTGCGWCVRRCPFEALASETVVLAAGGPVRFAAVIDRNCVACGLCELECANGAIRVFRPEDDEAAQLLARNAVFVRAPRGAGGVGS